MAGDGGGALDPRGGLYALVCSLPQPARIAVGRLGEVHFPSGWYVYVGSARGPGGLAARVGRHLRAEKRVHWHVDHLLAWAQVQEAWGRPSAASSECAWAQALARLPGARRWPQGFGASDCRCPGHCIAFPHRPPAQAFQALGAQRLWP
ncbi:MAG: GIY-YIG nuclease family protein [Anaerolineae bacterium]|nr:GIY-YIG nuclease family protein [Anaerolineae bacterium]